MSIGNSFLTAFCCASLIPALAACGPAFHTVRKGPPHHVKLEAERSKPASLHMVRRIDEQTVEVKTKQFYQVEVAQTVHYAATETVSESHSLLWELVEIPLGLVTFPIVFIDPTAGHAIRPSACSS